jgi:hypothetical protein
VDEYLSFLIDHAIMTLVVFAIGHALWRGIGASSEVRRSHGRYVLGWCVGGYFLGGLLGPFVAGAETPTGATGFAGFCLLAGWVIGTLHGAVALAVRRTRAPAALPGGGSADAEHAPGAGPPRESGC